MNREWAIAGIGAALCHGLLLFGLHLESTAVPLPVADSAVDVSVVDGAPAPPATAAASVLPAESPPPPDPVPPPPQAPPPEPVPPLTVPEMSHESVPAPTPAPRPAHHEPARPAHPNAAARAAETAPAAHAEGPPSAAAGAGGSGRTDIRARYNPKPPYPPEAERLHQEGRVGLEVRVGADGRVISVRVSRSSGIAILDAAAVEGVKRWTFEPARIAGLAVEGRADVPVVFSLSQGRDR